MDVIQLTPEEHEEYREAWVATQLAHTGRYYPQGDAARAFRRISKLSQALIEKYEIPPEEDAEIDVDRGIIRIEF